MKKQPQITMRTRKNLINGFWKLYKEEELSKITVGNICITANYERTSFYRYFKDINDILNQLENDIIEGIKDNIRESIKSEAFTNFKSFVDTYGEYLTVFHEKGNITFYSKFKELVKSDVYNYLNLNIEDEEKKEFIFEFIFSSLINSYSYWYRHQDMMDLESFADLARNILQNGTNSILEHIK